MTNPFLRIRDFLADVSAELKKSTWPTRKELTDSTVVVIITIVVLGLFVALADVLFLRIISFLTKAT